MSYNAVGFNPGRSVLSALPAGSPSRGKAVAASSQLRMEAAKANQQAAVTDMKNEAAQRQAKASNSAKASQNAIQMQGKRQQIAHQGAMSKAKMRNMKLDTAQQKNNQKKGMFLEGLINS